MDPPEYSQPATYFLFESIIHITHKLYLEIGGWPWIGALVAEVTATLQDCLPRDLHFREELESSLDWATLERSGAEPLVYCSRICRCGTPTAAIRRPWR